MTTTDWRMFCILMTFAIVAVEVDCALSGLERIALIGYAIVAVTWFGMIVMEFLKMKRKTAKRLTAQQLRNAAFCLERILNADKKLKLLSSTHRIDCAGAIEGLRRAAREMEGAK
jgi:hypothetical protein